WDEALIVCTTEGLCACDPATGALRERWDAGPTWMLAAAGGRVLHGSSAGALRFSPGQARGDKLRAGEVTAVALHADGRAAVAVGRGLRTYDAALRETGRRSLPARVEALDLRRDGTVIAALEGGRVTIGEGKARPLPGWLAKEASPGGWRFDR